MPAHRLPPAKAALIGADAKNPQRFKARKAVKSNRPIGEPYKNMSQQEQAWWYMYVEDIPWLDSSHRPLLKLACQLQVSIDVDGINAAKASAMTTILGKMGATPSDSTKVAPQDDGETDPLAEFLNGDKSH